MTYNNERIGEFDSHKTAKNLPNEACANECQNRYKEKKQKDKRTKN